MQIFVQIREGYNVHIIGGKWALTKGRRLCSWTFGDVRDSWSYVLQEADKGEFRNRTVEYGRRNLDSTWWRRMQKLDQKLRSNFGWRGL